MWQYREAIVVQSLHYFCAIILQKGYDLLHDGWYVMLGETQQLRKIKKDNLCGGSNKIIGFNIPKMSFTLACSSSHVF